MEYTTLGRTGVRVSPLCLGAMMFGQWGNPDHDDSIRIIHAALDAGINFIDTADVYSYGESEEIVAKAIAGRRDQLGRALNLPGGRGQPETAEDRLDRPLPDAPPRPAARHRRGARRAQRPRSRGE